MKVTLLGAARTVTGSCYMIEADGRRFGIDCGMHQGNKDMEKRNWETALYMKPRLDFFLITHAHIDHSGLLPRMWREGFKGPVYCTEPTLDLLRIMLLDSAHIQETDAKWENTKLMRKGSKQLVEPLYTRADAEAAAKLLKPVKLNQPFAPAAGVKVTYRDAGHILGAAFLELQVTEAAGGTSLVFSGDIGRPGALLMNDPDNPRIKPDYLFMESTYGDRDHKSEGSSLQELAEAIEYSYRRRGKIIIPAFAVERTQEVLYSLLQLNQEGKLPQDLPIFVDSPLAIRATEVFLNHPGYLDDDSRAMMKSGITLPNVRFSLTADESRAINTLEGSAVIISASGMCNAGRVRHHLRHNIWDPNSCVVFVGYQGMGTPGRKIVDGAKTITLVGDEVAIKAKIFTINGFSAHAGQSQLMEWVKSFMHPSMQVMLMHGEPQKQQALADLLRERCQLKVQMPDYLEELVLTPGKAPQVQQDAARAHPGINWDVLLGDSEGKLAELRAQLAAFRALPWEEQAELRDSLLEVNARLLSLLAH
ncbi:MAG: MBL fold metallo-hydrolase [Deltaproteobacteria bacterium]|jgi:metallo-beta-lactamase family protein|nr:MBL fold metallo-hydrolase [Deltaproteobacteria bacterium]